MKPNPLLKISDSASCYKVSKVCLWLITLLLGLNLLPWRASAESGKGEKEAAKAEGGAEAKEGGEAEGGAEFVKKDEFLELNAAIEQLTAKVRSKRESLNKLLEEKNHIKDPVEFKKLVGDLEKEYREYIELNETLEKKKDVLRYRFPEKSFVKKDEKSELKPLEEMSGELLVEKQLNEFLKTVEQQYRSPVRSQEVRQKEVRQPASEKVPASHGEAEQNPEEFTKSLILKK